MNNLKLNFNRGETSLKIFEEGRIFSNRNDTKEQKILAGLIFDTMARKIGTTKLNLTFLNPKNFRIFLENLSWSILTSKSLNTFYIQTYLWTYT